MQIQALPLRSMAGYGTRALKVNISLKLSWSISLVTISRSQTTAVQNNTAFQLEDPPPSYEEAIKIKPLSIGWV